MSRPADRGGTDNAFTHFIPSNFSVPVFDLLRSTLHANTSKHVNCSNHFVHGRVVTSTKGVVVPLSNWNTYTNASAHTNATANTTAAPNFNNMTYFNVTVTNKAVKSGMKVSLATGGAVTELKGLDVTAGSVTYMLQSFAIADALIIRP